MKVVGLMGLRGSGKDTAASVLVSQLGFTRLAFADPLYNEVAGAFGVTVAFLQNRDTKETPLPELALVNCKDPRFVQVCIDLDILAAAAEGISIDRANLDKTTLLTRPRSPRETLQRWGTDYRRVLDGDGYWREQVERLLDAGGTDARYVLTDVRFPDEAKLVAKRGGKLARVVRPAMNTQDASMLHISEQAMLNYPVDYLFQNKEGRFAEMQNEVFETIRSLV